jgi:uncharacterized protein YbgA (DUF1722 family)/uncharacterized protein YbbK (DUF523 family)
MIRLGVSSCLLGENVRYDGQHKRDGFIAGTLARYVEFVPLCPEVAIGMGVPRPPIQLVGDAAAPRARGVADDSLDFTQALTDYGRNMARELGDISGYVFKNRSPSCGVDKVPLQGSAQRRGVRGIYAAAIMAGLPHLPVAQEEDLSDPLRRGNFLQRVLVYHRWQQLTARGVSAARLVDFHTAHKLVVMAHGAEHYRRIGRLVAGVGRGSLEAVAEDYIRQLMDALTHLATIKRHTNVLMHIMGYLKRQLTAADKAELLQVIHAYRLGRVPLQTPQSLLRLHFQQYPHGYVRRQVYLYPPEEEPRLEELA